jgi:hypothetical protein
MVAKPTRAAATEPPPPPETRNLVGYAAVVIGAVLLFLGWYGVSGYANVGQQIPYLASASIPGAALVIAGAVLVANDRTRRSDERAAAMVDALYRLLTESAGNDAAAPGEAGANPQNVTTSSAPPGTLVQVGNGSRFHRPECALVDGKAKVVTVDAADIAEHHLSACPICDPPSPID